MDFKGREFGYVDWIPFLKQGLTGSCKQGNESWGSINGEEFLHDRLFCMLSTF
jgi:hypothetical protein